MRRHVRPAWPLRLLHGLEEVFFSRALTLRTKVSKEKHSCLTKSTRSTSTYKKWEKFSAVCTTFFSTLFGLSKERGTWKQLFPGDWNRKDKMKYKELHFFSQTDPVL